MTEVPAQPQSPPRYIALTVAQAQGLIDYLKDRPFKEVAHIIACIENAPKVETTK